MAPFYLPGTSIYKGLRMSITGTFLIVSFQKFNLKVCRFLYFKKYIRVWVPSTLPPKKVCRQKKCRCRHFIAVIILPRKACLLFFAAQDNVAVCHQKFAAYPYFFLPPKTTHVAVCHRKFVPRQCCRIPFFCRLHYLITVLNNRSIFCHCEKKVLNTKTNCSKNNLGEVLDGPLSQPGLHPHVHLWS